MKCMLRDSGKSDWGVRGVLVGVLHRVGEFDGNGEGLMRGSGRKGEGDVTG